MRRPGMDDPHARRFLAGDGSSELIPQNLIDKCEFFCLFVHNAGRYTIHCTIAS